MHYNIKLDIVKHKAKFFTISIVVTVIGIIALMVMGLKLGVDFKSGTSLDITAEQAIDLQTADAIFEDLGLKPASRTIGGDLQNRVSTRFDKVLEQQEVIQIVNAFSEKYGAVSREENTVDTELAKELAKKAIYAVLIACIGLIIYISIRFEWRFALAANISILQNAFIVITVFSLFRLEVNLPFVAAVLTIIGYSINDTIIIFDRIRENLRFAKLKNEQDLAELVNRSIWQTMTRSINTVVTVLFGAVALLILGSEAIRLFSLAMVIGLASGAYSSIFIASPLWLLLKRGSLNKKSVVAAK